MMLARLGASLRMADYRRLWLSNAFANSGRWAYTVGTGWLMYAISHSTLWVGLCMFAAMIPAVAFGPFIGAAADRYSRKKVYAVSLAGCLLFDLLLFLVHVAGYQSAWLVLLCSLGLGAASSGQMTASGSMVPEIVPKERLYNATALLGVVNQGSEFFGSGAATIVLAWWNADAVLGLCALLYGCACALSLRMERGGGEFRPDAEPEAGHGRPTLLRPILDGFRYIRSQPVGLFILIVGLHCALTMSFTGLLPDYCAKHLPSAGSGIYGGLMTAVGLGAVAGSLLTAGISSRRRLAWVYGLSGAGSGVCLALLAVSHGTYPALGAAFAVGGTQAVFMAASMALVMERTERKFQGRVSSVYILIAVGFMAVSNLLYGSLGVAVDAAFLMIGTGLLFTALFLAIGLFSSLRETVKANEKKAAAV